MDVAIFLDEIGESFERVCKYLVVMEVFSLVEGGGRLSSGGRPRIGEWSSMGSPWSTSVHDL